MSRPPQLEQKDLIAKITRVFRKVGYEGASVAMLSHETGLKKASLYHRFPGGKMEMASQIMADAGEWLRLHILIPLERDDPPENRVALLVSELDKFYSGGKQPCLLNTMAFAHTSGPLVAAIEQTLKALISALAKVAQDAGLEPQKALLRAEEAVALIEGSLVLSRGLKSKRPFRNGLARLPQILLAD